MIYGTYGIQQHETESNIVDKKKIIKLKMKIKK